MSSQSPISAIALRAPAATAARPEQRGRWPRGLRWLAWAVAIWLLVWALAYAAVPVVLKSQIQKIASEKLGRQVSLGAVDFKPWSLELTLHDLAVSRAGAAATAPVPRPETTPAAGLGPQLHIRRIYMDMELQSLLRLGPVADALVVDEPLASVTHLGQGKYDIDDILAKLARPDPQADKSSGARFALYNLVLSGGRFDLVDASVGTSHALRDLTVAVPFLSNLPSQRTIKTAPKLAFTLNGSRFDTAAVSTPFAPNRQTEAAFTLRDFDLQPYLGYLPASLPFRLQGGVLQADIKLAFEQAESPSLKLSGSVSARQLRLGQVGSPGAAPGTGTELLAIDTLHAVLDDVRPLEQVARLSAVEISAPVLSVARDRAGRLNLLPVAVNVPDATKKVAESAGAASVAETKGQNNLERQRGTPVPSWKVDIARLGLQGGTVNWRDESPASGVRIRLKDLALNASGIAYPFLPNAPFQFDGSLGLDPAGSAQPGLGTVQLAPARLAFKGSATDRSLDATAQATAWPLGIASAYVKQWLSPSLTGRLDAEAGLSWRAAAADKAASMRLSLPALRASDLQLAENSTRLASVQGAEVLNMDIDLTARSFKAASLRITQPTVAVERDATGRWMVERWMASPGPAASPTQPASSAAPAALAKPAPAAPGAAPTPWAVAIDELLLDGGAMSFADKAGPKPVVFDISAANARLGGLALGGSPAANTKAAGQAPPMALTASLKLAAGQTRPGNLDFKGNLEIGPLAVKGQLTAQQLPVQAFKPYFVGAVNIDLLRADASFKGQVDYRQSAAGTRVEVAGDAALESFAANTLAPAEELLAWKMLDLRGLRVVVEPAKATRIDVATTALSDFFARVIVTPEGRVNMQDLLKPPAAAPVVQDAIKNVAVSQATASVRVQNDAQKTDSAVPPVINIGPISLRGGQVRFSDRFIKPNYSADLSELTGKLGGFSSATPAAAAAPAMADLELRGKAEGTASLEISGKFNPLVTPLALDITGRVRDLELPPLSPYAIKYAGYGIERGKMSVDVNYVVEPNGQLTARNKLTLNQLSFGDKAEGATASLPVKLAVALLADRNGVIDLELPISGSLNDPQFSLAPLIGKAIFNVIGRAITAPFSLLARALGGGGSGGADLAKVDFAPGSSQLTPDARAALDQVAKALTDRPGLQLTVTGTSSLDAERDAFQRAQLDERVRAEKRRQQGAQGTQGTDATEMPAATLDEYPALLKSLYRQSELERPRNLIGLVKDQPVTEMEKLLLTGITVSADDLRQLAARRAQAVKDYLVSRALPPARLNLAAAKIVPPDAKWMPHAELNLAMP